MVSDRKVAEKRREVQKKQKKGLARMIQSLLLLILLLLLRRPNHSTHPLLGLTTDRQPQPKPTASLALGQGGMKRVESLAAAEKDIDIKRGTGGCAVEEEEQEEDSQ